MFGPPPGGLSHIATPVVSTEGPLDFARGRLRPERRDLLSTISRLLWREGLSDPRFALRSRRRDCHMRQPCPKTGEENEKTLASTAPCFAGDGAAPACV